jgi:hypothetical protein
MNKLEYETAVADLVGYMEWMAEPAAQFRKRLGVWVVLFTDPLRPAGVAPERLVLERSQIISRAGLVRCCFLG